MRLVDVASRPRVVVVGLGPAGADLVPDTARAILAAAERAFVRTARHPAVAAVAAAVPGGLSSFDRVYDAADTHDAVYRTIVDELVAAAADARSAAAHRSDARSAAAHRGDAYVAYAVPGSPYVAERTVTLLRADPRITVEVVPALSFLDLAWDRLAIDPIIAGVRVVDGSAFAVEAAGERGPLLVAQCHSRDLLSDIKLAADDPGETVTGGAPVPMRSAVLLHHLGLPDEVVVELPWSELDRTLEPDHLTSLWVPRWAAPVAGDMARLDELVRTLRARCPWDRSQTHGSLARHLLEEAYETLDAIEEVARSEPDPPPEAVDHLEEELGDLLFQVCFHCVLASEEGHFTLADVARAVHDKLVYRHPHVFGDAVAVTPDDVAARWEILKKQEKGRNSVTDGIPAALPALALASKLQRKAESLSMALPSLAERRRQVHQGIDRLVSPGETRSGETQSATARPGDVLGGDRSTVDVVGEVLFALVDAARHLGVDPESALRAQATTFRRQVMAREEDRGA